MRLTRKSFIPMFTLISACSQAQPMLPAPAPVAANVAAPNAVVVDFGATQGRTATLSMTPPQDVPTPGRYHLQTASTVHHWVAADIAEYDVTLEVRTSPTGTFTIIGSGVTAILPTSGPSAATQAVFANLSQGAYYRAFVTAKGNVNHADNSLTLNSVAATADFDFTATQNVASTLNDTATVVFDSVGFSGTGNLTFASPADGGYSPPPSGPTVTTNNVVVPPTITQLTNQVVNLGVAVDSNTHNVWATNFLDDSVNELTSTGSVLGTFAVGTHPEGVAVDPVNDHVWVANSLTSSVTELTSTGSVVGTFTSGISGPQDLVVDPINEHVWVTSTNGTVIELTSTGSVLGAFGVGSSPLGVAVDPINEHVWVTNQGSATVAELTSTGSVLGTFGVGGTPYGVAVDPTNEHVWVANLGSNNVAELSSTGSVLGTFNVGSSPEGVAVDARNGNVWVANQGSHSVTELSSTGVVLGTFTVGISDADGVAVDPSTGHVWLTEDHFGGG